MVSFSIRVSAMADPPFVSANIPQERDWRCVKVIHVNYPCEAVLYSLGAGTLSCSLLARLAAVCDRFTEALISAAESFRHQMLVGHQLRLHGKAIRAIANLLERFDLGCASGRIRMIDVILGAVAAPTRRQFHFHDIDLFVRKRG